MKCTCKSGDCSKCAKGADCTGDDCKCAGSCKCLTNVKTQLRSKDLAMANRKARRAADSDKRRAVKRGVNRNAQILTSLIKAAKDAGLPGQSADDDDEEVEDDEDDTDQDDSEKEADQEDAMDVDPEYAQDEGVDLGDVILDAILGNSDDDEEDKDAEDGVEDDEEDTYTPDEVDAVLDAMLGVGDDEDDSDEGDAVKSKVAKAKKARANALKNKLQNQMKNVQLPKEVKATLIAAAVREEEVKTQKLVEKKAAELIENKRREKIAEKKRLQADRAYVDNLVKESLMNKRQGRSFVFGGEAERKGYEFDRSRMRSVNQLSGQYRRGTPDFKLVDIMRAEKNPEFKAGFLKEIKALGGATGSAGGYIVPEQWAQEFIAYLRPKAVVRKFARTIPMSTDTLHLPKQTGTAQAAWTGENSDITSVSSTDQTFSEIVFTAHKLVAFSKASNELLMDSTYGAEAIIREDLRNVVALKEDKSFLFGAGASNEPGGIFTLVAAYNSGSNIVSGSGTSNALKPEDIYTLMNKVENANGQVDVFVTSPDGLMTIRKLQDTTGNFIFSSSMGVNAPQLLMESPFGDNAENYGPVGTLFERPVYLTTQIASTVHFTTGAYDALTGGTGKLLMAGQSNQAMIGQRMNIEIQASNVAGSAFQNDQTWFRVVMREDFQLGITGTWAALAFA